MNFVTHSEKLNSLIESITKNMKILHKVGKKSNQIEYNVLRIIKSYRRTV